jgi:hypothetical protein
MNNLFFKFLEVLYRKRAYSELTAKIQLKYS